MSKIEKIFPQPDILNEMPYGRFVLTNLAAKRARQIKDGAPPLVRIDSNHPLSIALAEIAAGKIKPIMDVNAAVELDEDYSALDSLELGDMGLLLPAIDDEEAELVTKVSLGLGSVDDEVDHEDEGDEDSAVMSLADVLGDDEPEEAVAASGDDAEISLDDLAQQEEGEDEDAHDAV